MAGLILGADIGQARDPTALAVVDGFDVVHLERLALGTPYPAVAARIAAVAAEAGDFQIVIDSTGVGKAVVDLLEERGLEPIAVNLTAGNRVLRRGRRVSLPRLALFTPLMAAVQAGRLRVAAMPYTAALEEELRAMRASGGRVEARGRGHHGDLATAVALALWWSGMARLLPG